VKCRQTHRRAASFPSVVALIGAALSRAQEELLVRRFRRVKLMLEGDEAGRTASRAAERRLASRCLVDLVGVDPGRQPDQMSDGEIRRALEQKR